MGQKDPLTEWQREGFEMFGALMKGIAQDFVKYVMHVQVVRQEAPAPVVQNLTQTSSDDQAAAGANAGFAAAAQAAAAAGEIAPEVAATAQPQAPAPVKQQTVVKDEWSKTPRNAPCPCGSGKKFKLCHGASTS
jgi:preprotein translocase subunit SecA